MEGILRQGTGREDAVHACWSCGGPVSVRAPFCHTCGVIQPPRQLDHFTRLNLPVAFDVSTGDLERQYFGLQRYFHPDRFAARSAKERALSLQHATSLNQAYEVLRRPLSRAEYLLELAGRPVRADEAETISDPELLMEAMEMREELAEATEPAAVQALVDRVSGEVTEAETRLAGAFAAGDLDGARRLALRLRYLGKLLDEARQRRSRMKE